MRTRRPTLREILAGSPLDWVIAAILVILTLKLLRLAGSL